MSTEARSNEAVKGIGIGQRLSVTTVFAYLFGSRQAIVCIAASPSATWIGLLFVFSAGFAREYDGEDLLANPWYLLIPLAMSLFLATTLYSLVTALARRPMIGQNSVLSGYRVFLRVFWMTAPLAWLYAIPVESFLSAGDATCANLWLLGIVSMWRVALMVRVISVLWNIHPAVAAMPVLLFADSVALIALWIVPLPVVSFMGGIRLTESEQLIQATAFLVGFLGTVSWPIWFLATLGLTGWRRQWEPRNHAMGGSPSVITASLWMVAACALLLWLVVLPITQPPQQLRQQVERRLRNGQIDSALTVMSEHQRSHFPPHWDPPPRPGYGETSPSLLMVLKALRPETATWVRQLFFDKLSTVLHDHAPYTLFMRVESGEIDEYLNVLERWPEGREIVRNAPNAVRDILRREDCSPAQQERVERLLAAVGQSQRVTEEGRGGEDPQQLDGELESPTSLFGDRENGETTHGS